MPQVNLVEKKLRMSHTDIIKYQLITYCFIHKIRLSDSDIECLMLLAQTGQTELTQFCNQVASLTLEDGTKIFNSAQTVRNSLNKAYKNNLVVKRGKNKKIIYLNPDLKLQSRGNILLDFKFLGVEPEKV